MTGQTEPRLVDPTPFVPAQSSPVQAGPAANSDGHAETTAGSLLAGRYRLGIRVGSDAAAGAEFWRAEDTVLRRDVAATVLRRFGPGTDPDDDGGAVRAQEIIARALRSGSFEHPGCARLLDVLAPGAPGLPDGVLGAAVAEWVPGHSLADAVADGMLKPLAAARALQPLAAAAEAAHRHGHVLGCDHPQRIRLNHDGRLQMGFALPRPELTPADDVRGLGAALYTLLTARWPLSPSDAARAGLKPAERGVDGAPLPPSTVRPGVPVELETLVVGTLGADSDAGRVRTAAAVRSVVDEVVAEADRVVLFPPEHDGVPPEPGDVWQPRGAVPKQPDPAQAAQAGRRDGGARAVRARRRRVHERAARRAVRRSDPAHRGRQQRGRRGSPPRPRRTDDGAGRRWAMRRSRRSEPPSTTTRATATTPAGFRG